MADVCGAAGDLFIAISLTLLFHRARSGIVKFGFLCHLSPRSLLNDHRCRSNTVINTLVCLRLILPCFDTSEQAKIDDINPKHWPVDWPLLSRFSDCCRNITLVYLNGHWRWFFCSYWRLQAHSYTPPCFLTLVEVRSILPILLLWPTNTIPRSTRMHDVGATQCAPKSPYGTRNDKPVPRTFRYLQWWGFHRGTQAIIWHISTYLLKVFCVDHDA